MLSALAITFIFALYWVAVQAPMHPRPLDGRVYAYRIPSRHVSYKYRQVVYLTKIENLLIGPVTYVLLVTFVSVDIFVGYRLKRLRKYHAEMNRTSSDNPSRPQVRPANRHEST